MAGPNHRTQRLRGWPSGVNNVFREDNVPQTQLRKAVNVDLLERGKVRRRSGYTPVLEENGFHSLVAFANRLFAAQNGKFYEVDFRQAAKIEIGDVAPHVHLDYAEVNEFLVVSDGKTLYKLTPSRDFSQLALETPHAQPDVSAGVFGSLPTGTYQVAVTYLRANGEESGASLAVSITLDEQGGLAIDNLPQPVDSSITHVRIYATRTDATELLAAASLPVGTTTAYVGSIPSGKPLETQFLDPLVAGSSVALHNGQLCSANGRFLYYSEPFHYALMHRANNYVEFSTEVTMVRAVSGGVFVGLEDKVVFLQGRSIAEASITTVDYDGVVPGTPTCVSTAVMPALELGPGQEIVVWWSTRGVMLIGLPDGSVRSVREAELSLPEFERGAIIEREQDGVQQLVSALSGIRRQSSLAMTDSVDAVVYRNNIEL